MDQIQLICELVVAICGVIPTFVSLFYLVRNIIKNKNWELIKKIAQEAMTTVEQYAKEHPGMKGEDKKNMAVDAIKAGLSAAGITFDEELLKKIVAYIEEMCKWSKTVNA